MVRPVRGYAFGARKLLSNPRLTHGPMPNSFHKGKYGLDGPKRLLSHSATATAARVRAVAQGRDQPKCRQLSKSTCCVRPGPSLSFKVRAPIARFPRGRRSGRCLFSGPSSLPGRPQRPRSTATTAMVRRPRPRHDTSTAALSWPVALGPVAVRRHAPPSRPPPAESPGFRAPRAWLAEPLRNPENR